MANLALTASCNRGCGYCFAMNYLESRGGAKAMPLETLERALDFLERSGIGEARLLGGEPTLHPHFEQVVDRALERGFRLLVFTGGLIPARALRKLASLPQERCSLLVNVIPPGEGRTAEHAAQARVFRALGPRVVLGINIARPGTPLDFLVELIDRYGLARSVRLGLAHPVLEGENEFLHPRHYPEVGRRVARFGALAAEHGVELVFDCGWVPCMFPDGAMQALGLGPQEVGLRCNPILDVMPDGEVISCFPLARHAVEVLERYPDAGVLRRAFRERQAGDRAFMLYAHCAGCEHRAAGRCSGGCLAGSLRRVRSTPFTVTLPGGAAPSGAAAGQERGRRSIPLPILHGSPPRGPETGGATCV
ncbi:MAG TPA: radical SAM protein [Longimicrobium sp.]|nr:radical SAM protein [Longimicrobium sp.]